MMSLLLLLCLAGEPETVERVAIEADEIGVMTEETLRPAAEEAAKIARQHDIDPADVSVSLVWENRQEFVYGIRVRIGDVLVDDKDPRGPIVHRCRDCSTKDLVTASVEGVLEGVKLYEEQQRQAEEEAERKRREEEQKKEEGAAGEQQPRPEVVDEEGISAMGKAGIAGIVIGSAGVVTGVAFIAVGTTRPEVDPTQLRQFRPSGYIALGVGVAVLATGIGLLAADRAKARKNKAAFAPAVGPGYVGLQGRFRF